ncbi:MULTISPECIES: CAP domain-containing protein [unclassified Nocardiopsis]|uniref:CAP domain-containing protein n=1 Tax=unclassified Nocardiopsis TaxID=2649073 RepID=UPI001359C02D|nr:MULTISPECIES: CAP domain-containing protein [unclassified Nocardiopsis]
MARGRRGRRRSRRRGSRAPLAAGLTAVPVGLAVAAALLVSGAGEDLDPFRTTADGQIGDAVTGESSAPSPTEDDFFARPSPSPQTPAERPSSYAGEPESADVTASSLPEDPEERETEDSGNGGGSSAGGGSGDGSGGGGSGNGGGSGGANSGGVGSSTGVAGRVVTLVNSERAAAGCDPLRVDDRLTAASQEHSEDMDRRDYMSHQSPEGEGPGDRARRHGYDAWGAENVAKGQTSPEQVMNAWMNSEGHRANILNCDLVAIGVGESGNAWTQMFGWE